MKPSLSVARSAAALRKTIGEIEELHPLPEGEESQVFGFRRNGCDFVARISGDSSGFRKDRFVYQNFARAALPIPEVAQIAALDEGLFLCISRRAPGVTLQDLDEHELSESVRPVARVMEAIAGSDAGAIAGFGVFDANGDAADESWCGFLAAVADRGRYDWNRLGRCVSPREIEPLLAQVCELSERCPEVHSLAHGDFGSNNVLISGGKITAVIDWAEALIGDPLYDVANIFFWRTWLNCMELQAQYLEPHLRSLPRWRERILCYQLRIGLEEVYRDAMEAEPRKAAWALARCLEIAG